MILKSGKLSRMNWLVNDRKNKTIEVREVDILPYVTWKEGHFLFKNQSLEKIMDVMARWYDVSVEFQDESIRNLHFTGDTNDMRIFLLY